MRREVESAVAFLGNILKRRRLSCEQVDSFREALNVLLCSHYQNHWFPDQPMKGSGYRCIRINHNMDPLLSRAGGDSGLGETELFNMFPKELTMWIDPQEVCYRIGEDGSVGVIFGDGADESCSDTEESSGEDSRTSSTSESTSSSPSPLPATSSDFLQSCKLSCLGLSGEPSVDTINYLQSHLATFVAS